MPRAFVLLWVGRTTKKMYKLLSKKLLGEKYRSALRSLMVAVMMGAGLHGMGTVIPLAQSVLIFTCIVFSGTIIIQTLSSKDNARTLKGLFAMPHDDRKTLWEYAAAIGAYTLTTKTSLLAALLFAFVKLTPLYILLFVLCSVYAVFGGMAAYGLFRKMPVVSALIVAAGAVMAFFLPKGMIAAAVLAAADIAVAVIYSFLHLDAFYVQDKAKLKTSKRRGRPKLLILRYITRYLLANKNYIVSTLFITGFAVFFAMMLQQQGMPMGCGLGMAFSSLNTPLAVVVSSNRGLNTKLNVLPDKTRQFFVPYAVVLFFMNMVIYALFLGVFALVGGDIPMRAIISAPVFAAECAAFVSMLEDRFTITKWKTEPDLWHNPRKYILPAIITLEAALIFML